MPLTNEAQKIYTEVVPNARLVYVSRIDFVPDVEPYEHTTVVTLERGAEGVSVTSTSILCPLGSRTSVKFELWSTPPIERLRK